MEPVRAERIDDGYPCEVEMTSRRRRAPARNPVWLLDERDRKSSRQGDVLGLDEIPCGDPAARPMTEHNDPSWRLGFVDEGARLPVGSTERESTHTLMV